MSTRFRCKNIGEWQSNKVFFDTNIVLSLFTPLVLKNNANEYSRLFGDCLKNSIEMYIDTHVLSEFINKYIRYEYQIYLKINNISPLELKFKSYRSLPEGVKAMELVESIVKNRLLKRFLLARKAFVNGDIAALSFSGADFNDLIILEICKENALALVTDDSDFLNAEIAIISEKAIYHTAYPH